MSDAHAHTSDDHGHDDHGHTSLLGYFIVLLCLMFLTGLTYAAFLGIHNEALNVTIALIIAFTKVALVIYFFMHVREAPKIILVTAISGFIFVGVMLTFFVTDVRGQRGDRERWQLNAWPATELERPPLAQPQP